MKHSKTMLAGAILLLVASIPALAMAQDSVFGQKMNKYLDEHPNMAAKVRADPSLLYDQQFRQAHPSLQIYMQNHPEVYQRMEQRGLGAYDSNHVWRSAGWFHDNDPAWLAHNHPEWAANHPEWGANHPGFDANHAAWVNNHPVADANHAAWVNNHPGAVEGYPDNHHHHQ
jgi:hypothetical protein